MKAKNKYMGRLCFPFEKDNAVISIEIVVKIMSANTNSNVFTDLANFSAALDHLGRKKASSILWIANAIGNSHKNQGTEFPLIYFFLNEI